MTRHTYFKKLTDTSELVFHITFTDLHDVLEIVKICDLYPSSFFAGQECVEIGAKRNWTSPWATNAMTIFQRMGFTGIDSIRKNIRYLKDFAPKIDPLIEENYSTPFSYTFPRQIGVSFDSDEAKFLTHLAGRKPNEFEIMDYIQTNSEHSRHHFFKGKLIVDGAELSESLMEMVQKPWKCNPHNSLKAFCDDASVIQSFKPVPYLHTDLESKVMTVYNTKLCPTFTAETHNFPTMVAPFEGANTGVGGRIRDTIAVGRGGEMIAGTAGYSVEDTNNGTRILIEASNGASDYGNKVGEPIIGGFTRVQKGFRKPIMFSGGIGQINSWLVDKITPKKEGLLVCQLGGFAYRIGMGGSQVSSQTNTIDDTSLQSAVQRGDPEMESKVVKFIRSCGQFASQSPILTIHDQGAGGLGNAAKEIVEPLGADIDLTNIPKGDHSVGALEKWVAEYQENMVFVCEPSNLQLIHQIAQRENVRVTVIGQTRNNNRIVVKDNHQTFMDLPLTPLLHCDQRTYNLQSVKFEQTVPNKLDFKSVLQNPTVGSKRFLTNKVDRSVSGLVAQQQCVGPFGTPISNYSLVAQTMFCQNGVWSGIASSIGECSLTDTPKKMVRRCVGEMLTNLMGVYITSIHEIRCSANWMWAKKDALLVEAVKELSDILCKLNIAIDGGKDSLSMSVKDTNGTEIESPRTLVLSSYVNCPNVYLKVTPEFKQIGSAIVFIPIPDDCPDKMLKIFNHIQSLIKHGQIRALHDVSDGGIFTTLTEMCIASDIGARITLPNGNEHLFTEELGVVLEVSKEVKFGNVIGETVITSDLKINEHHFDLSVLRSWWEHPSYQMEYLQVPNKECIESEHTELMKAQVPHWLIEPEVKSTQSPETILKLQNVAILREEGSNGEREMASAFSLGGYLVFDITMTDLQENPNLLNEMDGVAFVGGFSFMDTFGAGKGWAEIIKTKLASSFQQFFAKPTSFSLGVCNGCQVLLQINEAFNLGLPLGKLVENKSQRFESRFVNIKAKTSDSFWLRGLSEVTCGMWSAHAEGRFVFDELIEESQIAFVYADPNFNATEVYPYCPNGSKGGVAGVISRNGRHLAMMPHPERSILRYQLAWCPEFMTNDFTPWMKLFAN